MPVISTFRRKTQEYHCQLENSLVYGGQPGLLSQILTKQNTDNVFSTGERNLRKT